MISILQKEVAAFLNSMIAYIIIVLFLVIMGMFMWVLPDTSILNYGFAEMNSLFSTAPFIFMFVIPAITMRMFAEEKKTGTIELLMTKPVSDWDIIIGKYLSSVFLVALVLLPTIAWYFAIYELGSPIGNIDTAGVIGSYLGLFLLGAVFSSIGIFASSITDNQIVSFIVGVFICYIFHSGLTALSSLPFWGSWAETVDSVGVSYHYNAMSKGLIDSRDVFYFLSVIFVMLSSTQVVLGSRKW